MLRFLANRLISAIPVLIVVSLLSFLLIWLVPGDAASAMAGPGASAADLERIRHQLGLDRPFLEQLVSWYARLLQGDLGHSLLLDGDVAGAIVSRAPVTLSLTVLSFCLALVIGIALGIAAALRRNSWVDQSTMTVALLGLSLPDFWVGLMMIYTFAVLLGWLPTGGYVEASKDLVGWMRAIAMPALALALTQMGLLARITRSSLLEVLRQDYIRTARAKGLPRVLVIGKHALANAAVPVITVAGIIIGLLLSGAVVVESVFSLPGIGRLIIGAILRRDYPVIQGGLLLTATTFVLVNITVDVLYAVLDPRVRLDA